jgi:hypothetical protein
MRDDDEPPDVQILHIMQELLIAIRVGGSETPVVGGEKDLPNLLVHAHFAQRGFHPSVFG